MCFMKEGWYFLVVVVVTLTAYSMVYVRINIYSESSSSDVSVV